MLLQQLSHAVKDEDSHNKWNSNEFLAFAASLDWLYAAAFHMFN